MTNEEMNELDKWLAENVLGWKAQWAFMWNRVVHSHEHKYCYVKDDMEIGVTDWHPTRNITQAFEVLEKLWPDFELGIYHEYPDVWRVTVTPKEKQTFIEIGADFCLTVCLATRKAWETK
jgi:hypothetical protein